jgi:hypothetical protein
MDGYTLDTGFECRRGCGLVGWMGERRKTYEPERKRNIIL